jgi:hypothetical protein
MQSVSFEAAARCVPQPHQQLSSQEPLLLAPHGLGTSAPVTRPKQISNGPTTGWNAWSGRPSVPQKPLGGQNTRCSPRGRIDKQNSNHVGALLTLLVLTTVLSFFPAQHDVLVTVILPRYPPRRSFRSPAARYCLRIRNSARLVATAL